jgi:DNA-binding HxlR family transcriptional regulator
MKTLADYRQKNDPLHQHCPVRAALDVIRGRWKPSIVHELSRGPRRFGDLKEALRHATAQALTVQLRQLESDGVITRTVYPEIPLRVEYSLTSPGRTLFELLDQLEGWGIAYLERRDGVRQRQSA